MADTCRSCKASIIWARSSNGKPLPLNPRPSESGNIELNRGIGEVVVLSAKLPGSLLYTSHFATCPQAAQHRQRKAT